MPCSTHPWGLSCASFTKRPQPHLNGKHTIFGRVVEGYEVVENISNVQVSFSKPVKDVVIRKLRIERVGRPAR